MIAASTTPTSGDWVGVIVIALVIVFIAYGIGHACGWAARGSTHIHWARPTTPDVDFTYHFLRQSLPLIYRINVSHIHVHEGVPGEDRKLEARVIGEGMNVKVEGEDFDEILRKLAGTSLPIPLYTESPMWLEESQKMEVRV